MTPTGTTSSTQALLWFGRDDTGTAAYEDEAWATAMRAIGEAVRETD